MHDTNPFEGKPAPQRSLSVVNRRRDGKYTVNLHFPISGRTLCKILTREQIDQHARDGYEVLRSCDHVR